jgi:hypothetical protein
MFEDSTLPMKKIRENLNQNNSTDWIRRKQNILIYLDKIITYISEKHEPYNPSLAYRNNKKRVQEEEEEDNVTREIELAEHGNYDRANSPAPLYDPSNDY